MLYLIFALCLLLVLHKERKKKNMELREPNSPSVCNSRVAVTFSPTRTLHMCSGLKFIIVKTEYRHWTATGHYWNIKNKIKPQNLLYYLVRLHTTLLPVSWKKEIKKSATAKWEKKVIDGNIKMYLKMHHIDSFMKSSLCLGRSKFIAICDFSFIIVSPRGVECVRAAMRCDGNS